MNKNPFVKPINWCDPVSAFSPFSGQTGALALISDGRGLQGRWSILCVRPTRMFGPDDPLDADNPLLRLAGQSKSLDAACEAPHDVLPFTGGLAGFFSYEYGASMEQVFASGKSKWPGWALGEYTEAALFDHQLQKAWVLAPDRQKAAAFASQLGKEARKPDAHTAFHDFRSHDDASTMRNKVAKVIDYIRAGDVFQANISRQFSASLPRHITPFDAFQVMVAQSQAPFCGYFVVGPDQIILSNSPERFLHVDRSGMMTTSPIKGTRPRGKTKDEDKRLASELVQSAKDRAENLMIVDLMRNDLARICEAGSVQVRELFALHSFANVHHLVSTITAQLKDKTSWQQILHACFPPGSITGAPKVRAMQIIAELEMQARGPYCGALGFLSNCGQLDMNVLIRTIAMQRDHKGQWTGDFRAGSGIVADSDPAEEVEEMNDKAASFQKLASGGA